MAGSKPFPRVLRSPSDLDRYERGRRSAAHSEFDEQIPQSEPFGVAVIRAASNARASVAKQIREKHGWGLVVPIPGSIVVLTNVELTDWHGERRTVPIDPTTRDGTLVEILELWWSGTGRRKGWVGGSNLPAMRSVGGEGQSDAEATAEHESEPEAERIDLGRTNGRLRRSLEAENVSAYGPDELITIEASWDDAALQRALRRSNHRLPEAMDPDVDLPDELFTHLPDEIDQAKAR